MSPSPLDPLDPADATDATDLPAPAPAMLAAEVASPAAASGLPVVQVDAFTDRPFRGNPAAVVVLPAPREDGFLQDVAREMNLSETAFLQRREVASGNGGRGPDGRQEPAEETVEDWDLRWFTPATEVDLCGHATLASAHVLWQDGLADPAAALRFHTLSGVLVARRVPPRGAEEAPGGETAAAGGDGAEEEWIELDFPALPPRPMGALPALASALGEELVWVGGNGSDLLVELASESIVRNRCPDLAALRHLPARGLIVTAAAARADAGYDFVSRFFAPAVGVDEDPVTGSAHCCLGPFWAERLGKEEVVGYQASARGGTVRVRMAGERVVLSGRAVTVIRGRLVVG